MRFRWKTEVEDAAGRDATGWRALLHARAHLYLGDDDSPVACLRLEWNLHSRFCGFDVELTDDGEDVASAMVALPPVAIFASVDSWRLAKVVRQLTGTRYGWQREVSVKVHDWAVWWRAWSDPHHWSSSTPRWRDGSWRPFGFPGKLVSSEVVEEREVDVPFPARTFRARAKREAQRRRADWCPLFVVEHSSVTLDFEHLEKKPEGRKGTIWSTTGPARTIDEAVGRFVGSELRYNRAPERAAE